MQKARNRKPQIQSSNPDIPNHPLSRELDAKSRWWRPTSPGLYGSELGVCGVLQQASASALFSAQGVRFFFVLEGEVSVFCYQEKLPGSNGGEGDAAATSMQLHLIETLKRGQAFGDEYVLAPNKPFSHCVKSNGPTKVR